MQDKFLIPNWPAPSNIAAFTSLRNAQLMHLNLPTEPVWLSQVHGTQVISADTPPASPKADASIAFQPNKVCAVRTADCVPILLCDQAGTQVAAIHAGWRGLAAGVIAATCKQLTAPLHQCLAWIGPAIGPQKFEVGSDVLENFKSHGWLQEHVNAAFMPQPDQKWLGNLVYLARLTLQQQGIPAENIYGGEWCTYSDPERFYSYRRSSTDPGRLVSLIWRK